METYASHYSAADHHHVLGEMKGLFCPCLAPLFCLLIMILISSLSNPMGYHEGSKQAIVAGRSLMIRDGKLIGFGRSSSVGEMVGN